MSKSMLYRRCSERGRRSPPTSYLVEAERETKEDVEGGGGEHKPFIPRHGSSGPPSVPAVIAVVPFMRSPRAAEVARVASSTVCSPWSRKSGAGGQGEAAAAEARRLLCTLCE